jgi:hypothetical protein
LESYEIKKVIKVWGIPLIKKDGANVFIKIGDHNIEWSVILMVGSSKSFNRGRKAETWVCVEFSGDISVFIVTIFIPTLSIILGNEAS